MRSAGGSSTDDPSPHRADGTLPGRRPASRRREWRHRWDSWGRALPFCRAAGFVLGDLVDPALVTPSRIRGGEEGVEGVRGHDDPGGTAPETDHIGVIVLPGQAGGGHIVPHRGSDSEDLVGGDADADPGATDTQSQLDLAADHGFTDGFTIFRVIDGAVR